MVSDLASVLDKPFDFPDCTGKKILVLGLGGGCDIILAYAISDLFSGAGSVVYANTKKRDESHLCRVSDHIRKLSDINPFAGRKPARVHGTTFIDYSVPRGAEGCPWIFLLDGKSEQDLVGEIVDQNFDMLIGVDTGGDSLFEEAVSGALGRDKRMLNILGKTGLPLYHFVVAPGSDGESDVEGMCKSFAEKIDSYKGYFELDSVLPLVRPLCSSLGKNRTPNIILSAADGDRGGLFRVLRGCEPVVPRVWLSRCFVF